MSETIAQSITIKAAPEIIFKELLIWGEGAWWPRRSLMKFVNLSGGADEKTLYLQKVKFPLGPSWHVRNEVVDMANLYVKRVFLDGMFCGFEELSVSLEEEGCYRAIHSFCYEVKGLFNRLMWKILFKKLHKKNIDLIFKSLKKHLEVR